MPKKTRAQPTRLSRRNFLKWSAVTAGSALLNAACQSAPTVPPTLAALLTSAPDTATPQPIVPSATSAPATATLTQVGDTSTPAPPTATLAPTPTAVLQPPRNIILIMVDATRTDHLSAYGYGRPTTPNLDALIAQAGVRFTEATSPAAWTFPANAAIVTGRSPTSLGVNWNVTKLPTGVRTLAEHLQAAGYYTAGFNSAAFVQANRGFSRGFDLYNDRLARGHPTSYRGIAGELNSLALSWLRQSSVPGQQPLFLYLYYFDPHTWYNAPAPYNTLFDPDYDGPLTAKKYRDGQDSVAGTLTLTDRDLEHLLALYDGEIAYWDNALGELLAGLEDHGLLEDSLVIVSADHGDMFAEHGKWTHGNSVYNEVLKVPLLMRYPGVIAPGLSVNTSVQNMDVMPTILDWAGLPIPPELQAVSLRGLAQGATERPRDVFSEQTGEADPKGWAYWIAPRDDLVSVQRERWKLIHHLNKPESDELYQLNAEAPYETDNQLATQPELADDLRAAVQHYFGLTAAARRRWFSLAGW